ncbi:hypothetical protein GCM10007388_11790 [Pseudoduganella plicata]|uniref:Ice-binding protein C-terminal domain-containing protein n=3 Tax=Pseudoduganella plicata TaxID=321984 RepID=A0AA87Y5S5_9BURK|nr:hypothetical protein GCM10007388_11790 [Pseudoduganella plicata]
MALASVSHAAIYTFQYTARIDSITDGDGRWGEPDVEVASAQIPAGLIVRGDTVTGTFSYDRATVSDNTSSDDFYTSSGYSQRLANAVLTARFTGTGVALSSTPSMYTWVRNAASGSQFGDSFGMYSYEFGPAPSYWREAMSVDFQGTSTDVLDNTALPGAEITGFTNNTFTLDYTRAENGQFAMTRATGRITSVTLISAVPEPSTYAMFAAGLALLAWRRKRA